MWTGEFNGPNCVLPSDIFNTTFQAKAKKFRYRLKASAEANATNNAPNAVLSSYVDVWASLSFVMSQNGKTLFPRQVSDGTSVTCGDVGATPTATVPALDFAACYPPQLRADLADPQDGPADDADFRQCGQNTWNAWWLTISRSQQDRRPLGKTGLTRKSIIYVSGFATTCRRRTRHHASRSVMLGRRMPVCFRWRRQRRT
jgi:hypothetical protein